MSGCHVESLAFGKPVQLLDKKSGGGRVHALDLLRQLCSFDGHSNGAGDGSDRRVELSHPERDVLNGKFVEEHREDPFSQGFQETGVLSRSYLHHALRYSGIVDGVGQIVRDSGRPQVTGQVEIDGQGLRLGPFFRRHAAASAKFQSFDDDVIRHAGIVEERTSDCQAKKKGHWSFVNRHSIQRIL